MTRPPSPFYRQRGLSLVELLVAMAISLVLLAGIYQIFFSSTTTHSVNENYSRLQENARFALNFLERDVRQAGYRGCRNDNAKFFNLLDDPSQFEFNFGIPVEGFEAAGTAWDRKLPKIVTQPLKGSDIIALRNQLEGTVRHLREDMANLGDSLVVPPGTINTPFKSSGGDIGMISDCEGATVFHVPAFDFVSGQVSHRVRENATAQPEDLDRLYLRDTEVSRVATVLYYVRHSAEGAPCLYRKVGSDDAEALVEGVESMQILYGIDDDDDQAADRYLAASAALPWEQVVSLRIGLLLRSLSEVPMGELDSQVYNVNGQTIGPANDRHFRQVFLTTVGLRNRLF